MPLTRKQKKENALLRKKIKHVKVKLLKTAIRKHNKEHCIKLSQTKNKLYKEIMKRNIKFGYVFK